MTVSVPAAAVAVDGGFVGNSPLGKGLALTPGKHTLEAKRPGCSVASTTVVVGADTTTQASLTLAEDAAAIKVLDRAVVTPSEPASLVEIDGLPRSGALVPMPPGPHTLRVEKAGFLPTTRGFYSSPARPPRSRSR